VNQRGPRAWFVFGACLVLVGLALGWVTREVLALERREAKASEDARVQEAVRLALWRMDSAFAPVLAQEAMRAAGSETVPGPGAGGAAGGGGGSGPGGEEPPPAFRAAFTIDARGNPSRPEVSPFVERLRPPSPPAEPAATPPPTKDAPESAPAPAAAPTVSGRAAGRGAAPRPQAEEKAKADRARRAAGEKRLDDLKAAHEGPAKKGRADFDKNEDAEERDRGAESRPADRLEGALVRLPPAATPPPAPPLPPAAAVPERKLEFGQRDYAEKPAGKPASEPEPQRAAPQQQVELAQQKDEYQSRSKMAQQFQSNAVQTLQLGNFAIDSVEATSLGRLGWGLTETGPFEPKWVVGESGQPELFYVRTIWNKLNGQRSVQGLWCDWPRLERWLVSFTRDLLVDARLKPVPGGGDPVSFQLATIPAWLAPPYDLRAWKGPSSPTRLVLAAAWIAALGAIAAVGGVLKAALSLGERRGRFVSAVTHELRTPLTTFRMYSQMLADGMVPEESRGEYLTTLRDESERLTRVVESVLLYSRLEEGRGGAHRERIAARALIDRILPALSKRAADGGMALATVIEIDPPATVELDAQAVEQIVLNLVDNACKYAAPANDRLELGFKTAGGALEVRCRDWGPGIPEDEREAVFLPFRRGAKDAAGTTPGVGLGLALARGLARALGGDLVLDPGREPGACFDLTIPLVRSV
jgi:signal transduction histidine kinase